MKLLWVIFIWRMCIPVQSKQALMGQDLNGTSNTFRAWLLKQLQPIWQARLHYQLNNS